MRNYWLCLAFAALLPACRPGATPPDAAAATADCIDVSKINPDRMCTMQYEPVCGCDGKTYGNACVASNAGVRTYTAGPCATPKTN